jgi:NADH-quinone oxidoreductase subunit E
MLSGDERKEIEKELQKYLLKKGAAPEVLKNFQKRHHWISQNDIKEISQQLDMTSDELESTASAYNFVFRKPVGRHVIFVCDSVSCWIMGYEKIVAHLIKSLGITFGQTTEDGRFTLLPVACLGACDGAPAIMVDNTLHVKVSTFDIDRILEDYK